MKKNKNSVYTINIVFGNLVLIVASVYVQLIKEDLLLSAVYEYSEVVSSSISDHIGFVQFCYHHKARKCHSYIPDNMKHSLDQ